MKYVNNYSANKKHINKLEKEIKEEHGLYSVIVVDEPLKRHSKNYVMPEKIRKILTAVFKYGFLDHFTYIIEDDKHVVYTEPYNYIKIKEINSELANKYDIDLIPLKYSFHDEATYPYKIVISNSGDLKEPDDSIGFKGS